jgi:hypothetical protein
MMKKEYQKPEVEIIDLRAKEAITDEISLEQGMNLDGGIGGETSTPEADEGWLH